MEKQLLANKEQYLINHLMNVARLSEKIFQRIIENTDVIYNIEQYKKVAYFSGLFHDIGKTDPQFQNYITQFDNIDSENGIHIDHNNKNFSFEEHPRHNEISYLVLEQLFNKKDLKINKIAFSTLKNVVLWHHAAPLRKQEFTCREIYNGLKKENKIFMDNLYNTLDALNKTNLKYEIDLSNIIEDRENFEEVFEENDNKLIAYKNYFTKKSFPNNLDDIKQDILNEAIASAIKTIVVTADRIISAAGKDINIEKILLDVFENNEYSELKNEINNLDKVFSPNSTKSIIQKEKAQELSLIKNEISILNAPAGAGKTRVSLEWAKNTNATKIYYVAPRTIICEELFDEMTKKYFNKNVNIELLTGEKHLLSYNRKTKDISEKEKICQGDIVITTIDQIIKSITTHKNITILFDFLKSNVVFDEYHEYYKMSGFDLLFAELIKMKSMLKHPNTLLMSATPNFYMLEYFLDIYNPKSNNKNIVSFESFNDKNFNIKFNVYDDIKEENYFIEKNNEFIINDKESKNNIFNKRWDDKKTIIISNSATQAQLSFLHNYNKENCLLAHSKYSNQDKLNILDNIKNNFNSLETLDNNILRAGPIIQASLNITSERLITEISNPENILQRIGRLNRYSEDIKGELIIAVSEQILNNQSSPQVALFKRRSEYLSIKIWIEYLKNYFKNNSDFKLKNMYECYHNFYKDKEVTKILEAELLESLKNSYLNIKYNIIDPIEFNNKKNSNNKKLTKNSMRSKGYYTQMAVFNFDNKQLKTSNNYEKNIIIDRNLILNYQNQDFFFIKNTLQNFALNEDLDKKTLSFLKKAKKTNTDKYFNYALNCARSDNFNIVMSFNKEFLENKNKKNKKESIIYIKTDQQSVGYIQIKKLI